MHTVSFQVKAMLPKHINAGLIQKLKESFPLEEGTQDWDLKSTLDFVTNTKNLLIITFDGENIAGFLFGWEIPRLENKKQFYIDEIATYEKYQKQGVAKNMMNFLRETLISRNFELMYVLTEKENIAANKLYMSVDPMVEIEQDVVMFEYKL